MSLTVQRTTYETGSDKKLIVVDVYGDDETTKPVNNETSTPSSIDNKSLEGFIPKQATDLTKTGPKRPDFTLNDAMTLVTEVIKDPKGFRKAVGDQVMGNVLNSVGYTGSLDDAVKSYADPINLRSILKNAGDSNEQLKVIIDGAEKVIDAGDLNSVKGISEVIGGLTGNTDLVQILNLGPSLSIVNEFIGEAMRLELPQAVDALIESLDDADSQRRLRLHGTRQAAIFGDLTYLEKQIDNTDIGAGAINSLTPDIISVTLKNYKLGDKEPTQADAQKLIRVLNKLDSKWMKYQRGSDYIDNLSYLTEASDDAIRVLLKDPSTYVAALISGQLESSNMVTYTLDRRPWTTSAVLR